MKCLFDYLDLLGLLYHTTVASKILLLITATHTHIVLLLQAAAKVL